MTKIYAGRTELTRQVSSVDGSESNEQLLDGIIFVSETAEPD